jgi:DUF4097 and DUF4098 domain-containing protein YvlB
MTTFETPTPVAVSVELGVGELRVLAGEHKDTLVEVTPSDPASEGDVSAAEQALVEFDGERLVVKARKGRRYWSLGAGGESIGVTLTVPAGSSLRVTAAVGTIRCAGQLGECRLKTGVGDIHIEHAGPLDLRTGAGDVTVQRAVGHVKLATGSGAVSLTAIEGTAEIKNANGSTWIGAVSGELKVRAANGRIAVDHAGGGVAARTANGDVDLGEVLSGEVLAESGHGKVEIAVREGVAAWLDFNTRFGRVNNGLQETGRPQPGEDTVEIRARSAFGDITVRRLDAATRGGTP